MIRAPKGLCRCGKRAKAVRLIWQGGKTEWACRKCAELYRAIAGVITGKTPEYEPIPNVRRVK